MASSPVFDEKKPYHLFNISTGLFGLGFALLKDAVAEAERYITGDKSCRFVIFRAIQIIEPEPVKTRVRELK